MRLFRLPIFVLLMWATLCGQMTLVRAQTANVPLDHWVYDFIQRLETRGLVVSEDFSMRPFSRQAVAELLLQAARPQNSSNLSRSEAEMLSQFLGEFQEEIAKLAETVEIDSTYLDRHLYSWKTPDVVAHFDGLLSFDTRLETRKPADLGVPKWVASYGMYGRARLKESMSIFVNARSYSLSDIDSTTNTVFNPSQGLPVTTTSVVGGAVTDNVSSTIKFKLPWFDLQLGRDLVEWGPGFRGNLILSRNSNYYDMFRMIFRYKKAKLDYLHGFLNADSSKYLMAHRLEIAPSKYLRLSVSESVIYAGRDVEPLYLNPFVPIIIAERHLGNRDNNMMAFDGTWFLKRPKLKLYAEIMFDDFSFTKNLFTSWVNKWAILAGAHWANPLGFNDTEVRLEAVRIQPFVYSHRQPENRYINYNNSIGHWLGPDADDWFIEVRHRFHRTLEARISWEQRRKGQNDINYGTRPPDAKIRFLDGVVERNRYYSAAVQWQLWRDFIFSAEYYFIQAQNLYRKDGQNQNNHRLFLRANLNY